MNPKIEWMEWGRAAFDKSIKEEKPILLSINTSWCRFCGQMEKETYLCEEVINRVGRGFVPVRVNSDERPDINLRYNQGGWPSTVFLTSRGRVITGCTYASRPEFFDLLEQVGGIYKSLQRSGQNLGESENLEPPVSFEEKRLYFIKYHASYVLRFEELLVAGFDPIYGGFGTDGPKFPLPEVLELCLRRIKATGDAKLRLILERTLEGMSEGGLWDFLDGGFFRCCLDRGWQSPRFEKLLEDNVNLARVYFEAGQILGDKRFTEISERTIRFINQWLYQRETGAFFNSVSADADYYIFASRAERLNYLDEHQSPKVDTTVYTNGAALASDLYFELRGKEAPQAALNLLLTSFRCPSGLFFHYKSGEAGKFSDFLADQLSLVRCLLNPVLNSSVGASDLKPRVLAEDLWKSTFDNFYDSTEGGFLDRRKSDDDLGLLKIPRKVLKDNVEAVRLLKHFGQVEAARKTLIELLWQNKTPNLNSGPLATLLLENV